MSLRSLSLAKFVPLGLTVILTLMALFGIGAAIVTETENQAVNQAQYLSDQYQQARYWVGAEESRERKYRLEPSPENYQLHRAAAYQLQKTFQRIADHGNPADQTRMHDVLLLHLDYLTVTSNMFLAVDSGNVALVILIDHGQADPVFSQIETMVNEQSIAYQQLAAKRSQILTTVQMQVVILTPIVFVIGIILMVILWRIFVSYQRTLLAAHQEDFTRLEQAALLDTLTSLGNHRAYQEEVQRELQRAQRHDLPLSLALIDIDDFKTINDTRGHAYGDQVLQNLGSLLQTLVGTGRAYRIGGDGFALLLPHVDQSQASTLLESIRQAALLALNGATLSIGVTSLDQAETDMNDLREQANAALSEAKHGGRNAVVCYEAVRATVALVSAKKVQALRDLLAAGEMDIVFQPIWNVPQQHMLAVEALSRPSKSYGFAGPQEAFDIAERIGHEAELDVLCLRAILDQAHLLPPGVLLFLNVCPRSLSHPQLQAEVFAQRVRQAGLTPHEVVIEVTERSITRLDMLVEELVALRAQGFKIALDDTGAGNSGLELLTHLNIDYVKIDRMILVKAMHEKTARGVLAGIIAIARETGSDIIAEGVEDMAMLDLVLSLGAKGPDNFLVAVQGYLLGRPSASISTEYPIKNQTPYVDAA